LVRVAQAVAEGVSPICATCKHFWQARDQRREHCAHHRTCGGPIKGRMFPQYAGPMDEFRRVATCFMTGKDAAFGVRVVGQTSMVGIAADKVLTLAHLCRDHKPDNVTLTIVDNSGNERLIETFIPTPPEKTLANLIKAADEGLI
jgi:hypothetical protein